MRQLIIGITLFLIACCGGIGHARLHLCPGEFGIEGEWIYFLPSVDNTFYAEEGFQAGTIQREGALKSTLLDDPFTFKSGYRVGGGLAFCECDLGLHVRWTHLRSRGSDSSNGDPEVRPILSEFQFNSITSSSIKTNTHFVYDALEGIVWNPLFSECGCYDLLFLWGVEYARIDVRREDGYFNVFAGTPLPTGAISCDFHVGFYGLGPQIGFDGVYELGCGFGISGRMNGSLLVSRMEAKLRQKADVSGLGSALQEGKFKQPSSGITEASFNSDKNWRLVPKLGIRFGLTYEICFCDVRFAAEFGYEALSYARALPIIEGDFITFDIPGYSNADMHGPYINAALSY